MSRQRVRPKLLPEHEEDLARSGLSAATIAAAGIRSLALDEWAQYLPALKNPAVLTSALLFPYSGGDAFWRVRLFPAVTVGGHAMKYCQPAGSSCRLYLPPRARAALADPTVPLYWTEGEKKALKGDQEGLACIGLGGLWNWLQDGRPIPDVDLIDHKREQVLIPDSDVWIRPDLLKAPYALGRELFDRGASVRIAKLPAGADGGKQGLDDYLVAGGDLDAVLADALPLKDRVFSKAAQWYKGWVKEHGADGPTDAAALLAGGESARRLHPAQDVVDHVLYYGVPVGAHLVLVTSQRQLLLPNELSKGLALRHAKPGRAPMSREAVLGWKSGEAEGSMAHAVDAVTAALNDYMFFRDRRVGSLVAVWIVGTYLYRGFPVYPYLVLRSSEKGCGKTRLLLLISGLAFNADPPSALPSEAYLYRAAEQSGGTQLFDEVKLRGDKDKTEALIAVLNHGFMRGMHVPRMEKRGEQYESVQYEVYAPRALAGVTALKDTLESRSLFVFLVRRRRGEVIARWRRKEWEVKAHALRDACGLAALAAIERVALGYEAAQDLLEHETIDDRAADLWAPLVAIARVADAEDHGARTAELLALAREQQVAVREADAESGRTLTLVNALDEIRRAKGMAGSALIAPTELLARLQARSDFAWVKTTKALAGLMNPIGFVSSSQTVEGKKGVRAYMLDEATLVDLRDRYSAAAPEAPTDPPPARCRCEVCAGAPGSIRPLPDPGPTVAPRTVLPPGGLVPLHVGDVGVILDSTVLGTNGGGSRKERAVAVRRANGPGVPGAAVG